MFLPKTTKNLLDDLRAPHLRLHFSQFGEDCYLWHHFHSRPPGFYVDVGCHDPYRYSNTYLLYHYRNWSGINIDADQRAIDRFAEARPKDINICIGVGLSEGTASFTTFEDGAVNTFDSTMAESRDQTVSGTEIKQIAVRRLADILNQYLPENTAIHYMNVDCEGLDHDVILSNDWQKYRPEILSVEIHGMNLGAPLKNPTVAFLKEQGYVMKAHYLCTTFFMRRGK